MSMITKSNLLKKIINLKWSRYFTENWSWKHSTNLRDPVFRYLNLYHYGVLQSRYLDN